MTQQVPRSGPRAASPWGVAQAADAFLGNLSLEVRTVAVCHVADGWSLRIPPRRQPVLFYGLGGEASLGTSGGTVRIGPSDLVIAPASQAHTLTVGEAAPRDDARHATIGFEEEVRIVAVGDAPHPFHAVCGEMRPSAVGAALLLEGRDAPFVGSVARFEAVRSLRDALEVEIAKDRPGLGAVSETLLRHALVLVLREMILGGGLTGPWGRGMADPRIARALAAVLEDIATDHSLADLATRAGMSRSAFSDRFRQVMGATPAGLLREIRMRRAANLLDGGASVKTAASKVGFASRSQFSRAFSRRFGRAPSDWAGRQEPD